MQTAKTSKPAASHARAVAAAASLWEHSHLQSVHVHGGGNGAEEHALLRFFFVWCQPLNIIMYATTEPRRFYCIAEEKNGGRFAPFEHSQLLPQVEGGARGVKRLVFVTRGRSSLNIFATLYYGHIQQPKLIWQL